MCCMITRQISMASGTVVYHNYSEYIQSAISVWFLGYRGPWACIRFLHVMWCDMCRYRSLPSGSTFPCTVAEQPINAELNRFPHLLSYDHSRVKLVRPASDGVDSDYINANYVPGYDRRRKAYIAAQSPFNERTICDFWLMVYQQRVTKVTKAFA